VLHFCEENFSKESLMTQYKFITGPDDSKFCARITEFLNQGWKLYGSPTMSFDGKSIIAGQAIVKDDEENEESVCCGLG
jgi:hypothetical protein